MNKPNKDNGPEERFSCFSFCLHFPICSELGKITLDKTFEEREALNIAIVESINTAADAWGLQCLRYEIKDITPPEGEGTYMVCFALFMHSYIIIVSIFFYNVYSDVSG